MAIFKKPSQYQSLMKKSYEEAFNGLKEGDPKSVFIKQHVTQFFKRATKRGGGNLRPEDVGILVCPEHDQPPSKGPGFKHHICDPSIHKGAHAKVVYYSSNITFEKEEKDEGGCEDFTRLEFKLPNGERTIRLIAVHLQSIGSADDLTKPKKTKSYKALKSHLESGDSFAKDGSDLCIVAGDFNLPLHKDAAKGSKTGGLYDDSEAIKETHPLEQPFNMMDGFQLMSLPAQDDQPSLHTDFPGKVRSADGFVNPQAFKGKVYGVGNIPARRLNTDHIYINQHPTDMKDPQFLPKNPDIDVIPFVSSVTENAWLSDHVFITSMFTVNNTNYKVGVFNVLAKNASAMIPLKTPSEFQSARSAYRNIFSKLVKELTGTDPEFSDSNFLSPTYKGLMKSSVDSTAIDNLSPDLQKEIGNFVLRYMNRSELQSNKFTSKFYNKVTNEQDATSLGRLLLGDSISQCGESPKLSDFLTNAGTLMVISNLGGFEIGDDRFREKENQRSRKPLCPIL
eukprot:m.49837 g.49837  ORF g.49837 m.49837 type:complete len:508 (-) comp10633_c0_seq6:117-1640(-)